MCKSINVENKKQNLQKPPLSLARIACEILAGAVAGFAVAFPLTYVTGIVLVGIDEKTGPVFIGLFFIVFPPLYVLGSTFGVYLVGRIGNETGSFLETLSGGFLGGPVAVLLCFLGIEKIVLWALILLIPPIFATIGFNSTRRYKEPTNLKSTPQSQ
ncbi:MAG: hypothetical protein FVQ84_03950 [Planctomycetes bacterium]|nr:hypothetical protein [Planctomycetota bacterium]